MARARNIKPAIMNNHKLSQLPSLTRLLFIYLWMLADREGLLEDCHHRIGAQAIPYDRDADVNKMLADLEQAGFIKRYESNSIKCIRVVNFLKHQSPHGTEKDSELPDENGNFTVHQRGKHGYAIVNKQDENNTKTDKELLANSGLTVKQPCHNALIPDSGFLIPDSLIQVSPKPSRKRALRVLPPSAEFDRFYAEYPKKEGKKAAMEAFDKARILDVEAVIADVRRRKASREWLKNGGEFVPLPATYLNNRRWEDSSVSQAVVPWFKEAGFDSDWEAENARCFSHNYRNFRGGKRITEAA